MTNSARNRRRTADLSPQERAERERRRIRESLLDEIDVPDRHQVLEVCAWGMIVLAALVGGIGIVVGLGDMTPRYNSVIGSYGGNGMATIVTSVIASFVLFMSGMVIRAIHDIAHQQAITNAILMRQLNASIRQLDALHDTAQNPVSDAL